VMPLFAFAGSQLFDRPYDEKKGIHPKIYFSKTRPEGMGVLFGILVELIVFMAIYRDAVGLILMGGSLISGGVGFVGGNLMQIRARYPNKKGWVFLKKSREKGIIDTWKIAECAFGAIAGLGVAATFVLIVKFLPRYGEFYGSHIRSLPQVLGELNWNVPSWVMPAIFVALLGVDMLRHAVKRRKTAAEYEYMKSRGWMSHGELEMALEKVGKEPGKAFLLYEKIAHTAIFPIYCYLPLLFIFLGSAETASLYSFYVLYWVLVEQQAFDRFQHMKSRYAWRGVLMAFGVFVIFAQFAWGWTPGLFETVLMYGAGYEALTIAGNVMRSSPDRYNMPLVKDVGWIKAYGGLLTMHGYYFICIAIVTAFAGVAAYGLI